MFDVVTKQGRVVYTGLKSACWRYCEMHDKHATWRIEKHV